ncbi:MAG: hypothetical protein K6A44_03265 [bacterium]|nr:hypothetical protein [bacterium]
MFSEYFYTEEFAKNLASQAMDAFDAEIPEDIRILITQVIYEFILISCDELAKDRYKYNTDNIVLISQLVGEWMYHRGVDNYKNDLPQEYWQSVLQKVAFDVYKAAKNSVQLGESRETTIDKANSASERVYMTCMFQLAKEHKLNKPIDEIMAQSSLDDYVEENYTIEEIDSSFEFNEYDRELLRNNFYANWKDTNQLNKAIEYENELQQENGTKSLVLDEFCQRTAIKNGAEEENLLGPNIPAKTLIIPATILLWGLVLCSKLAIDSQNQYYLYLGFPIFIIAAFIYLSMNVSSLKNQIAKVRFWIEFLTTIIFLLLYIGARKGNLVCLTIMGALFIIFIYKASKFIYEKVKTKKLLKEREQIEKIRQELSSLK